MKPAWHYRPEANWINDPNGVVHHDGWYHLYYQYNPHSDRWGDIHWGHARSRDLLTWKTLPVALCPQHERKELHCFSGGCCKDENGLPHFFYTSVGDAADGLDARTGAYQRLALPADDGLTRLVQDEDFALTNAVHGDMTVLEWRDPCVVRYGNQYLMVLGGLAEGRGCVLLYTSPDLRTWTYRHILAQSAAADGVTWECPNIFFLDGKCCLIYSPCAAVRVKIGTLDEDLRFHEEREEILDPAAWNGFYAPQVLRDELGRTILFGWMPESDNVPHKGWSGVMALPRVLTLNADGLNAQPVPGAEALPGVTRCEVPREALPHTWTLHDNGGESTTLTLTPEGMLLLDRSRSTLAESPNKQPIVRAVPVKDMNEVFIAVDGSAVEAMVNGKWLSGRIYPTK